MKNTKLKIVKVKQTDTVKHIIADFGDVKVLFCDWDRKWYGFKSIEEYEANKENPENSFFIAEDFDGTEKKLGSELCVRYNDGKDEDGNPNEFSLRYIIESSVDEGRNILVHAETPQFWVYGIENILSGSGLPEYVRVPKGVPLSDETLDLYEEMDVDMEINEEIN